jgi:hypothetical protein
MSGQTQRDQPHPGERLRTFINTGLIVSVVVMLASFYVRFVDPYPPLWTACAMPAAMAFLGLRSMLLMPDTNHSGRSQRNIGRLLIGLSLVLLVLSLVELDMANKSRTESFNPNPTAVDPLNSTVPTDTSGDN